MARPKNIPEISRKYVGQVLRERRKKAGLTQIDISEKLGISQSAWSKFENGLHEPTIILFMRFCVLTNTPVDVLI
jgi:transcriptional regulator with XRE-family HTH domain